MKCLEKNGEGTSLKYYKEHDLFTTGKDWVEEELSKFPIKKEKVKANS